MSAAAGGEELSTLTNLTKNLEEQLKKAEIQHQKQQHESKETLERFMAGMADMWEQNKGRSTPMAVEDKSESTDDEGTQSNKTIVLLASTSKRDFKSDSLRSQVINPMGRILKSRKLREQLDKYLMQRLIVTGCFVDGTPIDPKCETILKCMLDWIKSQPHLARTSPPTNVPVTKANQAMLVQKIIKAADNHFNHGSILKLFGYVRARMADNVNLLLLRFVAPEKMPDPEEFAPHKNTITLPPSVMQGLKPALHKERKFLCVSPACDQDFQDDEDSIPPANVMLTTLLSTVNLTGHVVYCHDQSAIIKTFELVEPMLGMTPNEGEFPWALLAYIICLAQFKTLIVEKNMVKAPAAPVMKTMFGQMPSAKELVDHMANVEAFLQDAKFCPTDYHRIKVARDEEIDEPAAEA